MLSLLINTNESLEMSDTKKINAISRSDVKVGDRIIIETRNSTYLIEVLPENNYLVSGGWFDRNGLAPYVSNIHGCTMGSSANCANTIAALGLCIEFDNNVTTSPVTEISVWGKEAIA